MAGIILLVFERLLVAYDGSPGARRALDVALEVARSQGAELTGIAIEAHLPRYGATVGEVDEEHRVEEAEARRHLAEAVAVAAERAVRLSTEIRVGHPAQAIVKAAEELRADLIVIGHSGHSGVWGLFLGTTAEKVSRHAPCSVLIVR
jgi:nucleotide-binding universal stress UspA family protein